MARHLDTNRCITSLTATGLRSPTFLLTAKIMACHRYGATFAGNLQALILLTRLVNWNRHAIIRPLPCTLISLRGPALRPKVPGVVPGLKCLTVWNTSPGETTVGPLSSGSPDNWGVPDPGVFLHHPLASLLAWTMPLEHTACAALEN